MNSLIYNHLHLREIFHLEFLRWLSRRLKVQYYALKGGSSLRFFFKSIRYSEDMDLDVKQVRVDILKDIVMKILSSKSFSESFIPFGIVDLVSPDISKAKQTETTQRFKVHLITKSGEELFTKIEFSRRGFKGQVIVESVSPAILQTYKLPPLLVPHYNLQSLIIQKIDALVARSIVQPRDIFDLYTLSTQYKPDPAGVRDFKVNQNILSRASENILDVGFRQFRDTVLSYLLPDDRILYDSSDLWDKIKLEVANFIIGLKNDDK